MGSYMKYKTINFDQLVKLKKIQNLSWHFDTISFQDFRKTRQIFKNKNMMVIVLLMTMTMIIMKKIQNIKTGQDLIGLIQTIGWMNLNP